MTSIFSILPKRLLFFISFPLLFSLLFLLLFYFFIKDVKVYTVGSNKADVIVALSGGLGRVEEGLNLLQKEKGKFLIISGVNKTSDLQSIFFMNNIEELPVSSRIILEKSSTSTFENASEVMKIINESGFKSIILVTSVYHMKRAAFTFSRVLPEDVKIFYQTVSTENFDEEGWWGDRESIYILIEEFIKFYWYRLWI